MKAKKQIKRGPGRMSAAQILAEVRARAARRGPRAVEAAGKVKLGVAL